LSADVQNYLTERAAQKGIPLSEMVNTLLKHEIQLIESVKWNSRIVLAQVIQRPDEIAEFLAIY